MSGNNRREIPPPIRLPKQSSHSGTYVGSMRDVDSNISALQSSSSRDEGNECDKNSRPLSLFTYCVKALYPRLNDIIGLERSWTRRSYESPRIQEVIVELFPAIPRDLLESPRDQKTTASEPDRKTIPNMVALAPNSVTKAKNQKRENKDVEFDALTPDIHPQLWALINALVIPSTLPPSLRSLTLALSDSLIPSIQFAPCLSSQTLTLLTCLSLNSPALRQQITDDTLIHLRPLICLTLLDLARTPITSKAFRRLALSMRSSQGAVVGPRKLRVLYLNGTFVNDDLLDENGIDTFPLLFAVDLRDTGCTKAAISKVQVLWKRDCLSPQDFFSPTSISTAMDNISQIMSVSSEKTRTKQEDHAFLFIKTINGNESRSSATVFPEERKERDKKLRLQTSNVVVLTSEDALLGNVREEEGNSEEGSAKASFRPNLSHHGIYDDHASSSSVRWRQSMFLIPHNLSKVEEEFIDANHVLLRDPPDEEKRILSRNIPTYRDPKGGGNGSLSSQSLVAQPAPKRRRVEETYSVKRFKGATMSQIFGTNKSLSSRRL